MSSDLLTCLELDRDDTSKIIVIKEINGCNSSFVASNVLGHCAKNKNVVLIISTHNNIEHYHSVGLKMNYNVQKCIDSGVIYFYDIGSEILRRVLNKEPNFTFNIINEIQEKIVSLRNKHNSINIIIDGISHFFDVQFSLQEVNKLCDEVIKVIQSYSNSFLLLHCNIAIQHDVTEVLANLLSHKADIVVEVENLTSGLSVDVSGHLTIKRPGLKFKSDNLYIMQQKPSQYLFKLFDRGVKLLAPGTV